MLSAKKELFTSAGGGYQISRSVRLRSSASAYFSKFIGTASNRKTFTFSGWVKKAIVGSSTGAVLFCSTDNSTSTGWLHFNAAAVGSADTLTFQDQLSNTVLVTTQLFRDPSAWYHIIVAIDTTQATASDRAKLYVNGTQVTAFSTATYPALNADTNFTRPSPFIHTIGTQLAGARYFDGYLAEINFIDGQALTPSSFGETNAVTGVWQPKKYAGTYGTNGFYLNFSDNSGATATTIGKDNSGNGNNWTPNNISVTAGVTYDSMLDVPTPYADGGNGRGNYAVLNPVDLGYSATLSEANLKVSTASSGNAASASTMALSTNTYWEVTIGSNSQVGLIWGRASDAYGNSSISMFANGVTGSLGNATRTLSATPSWSNGDTLGFAWNNSTRVLTLYQAGSATAVMTMTTPATGDPNVAITNYTSGAVMSSQVNFGQRPFAYTPPTGFVALNTQNLPTPTISKGNQYFDVVTRSGTGATYTKTGLGFQPDFAWTKLRNTAYNHYLQDSVRGVAKQLSSDTTSAEQSIATAYTSFNSDGYTLGNSTAVNDALYTYVDWLWNAGGSTVTNTTGTISSQVRANATAGFSVVTFTAPASGNFSAGHGLGVTPGMVITKVRGRATSWITWHNRLNSGSPGTSYYVELNTAGAQASFASVWGSTGVTSSVIGMGVGASCAASDTIVAYCFAAVAGYSAFGSYTVNNSADGPFVYLGFRARWILFKNIGASTWNWMIVDTSRDTINTVNSRLFPDLSNAESSTASPYLDITANGFKIRTTGGLFNTEGPVLYAAFAENPFKYALAR
jgi:hypothetical protein